MSTMTSENYLVEKERGDDLASCGDLLGAIEAYNLAINYRPQFWGAYYMKGDTLLKLERFHDAAVAFWSASLYARGRPEPALMAGRALFSAEFYIDACSAFECVDVEKIDPDSALQFAICLLKADNANEALSLKNEFSLCENKTAVRLLLVEIYLSLKRFDDAAELISTEIQHNGENHTNLNLLAKAKFGSGEIMGSNEAITKAILDLIYQPGVRKNDALKKDTKFMSVPDATYVLQGICQTLADNKVNYFLDGGTLLGIIRDGDLLPYDKDMDIGIFSETSAEEIYDIFEARPEYRCKRPKNRYEEKQHYWNIVVQHIERGITVDFFFFRKIGDKFWNGFYNPKYPVLWGRKSIEVCAAEFKGFNIRIPIDTEAYLAAGYGDNWRIPDEHFLTIISAPSLNEKSYEVSQSLGLQKLYGCITKQEFTKAADILRQLRRLRHDNFLEAINEKLKEFQRSSRQDKRGFI